MVTGKRWTENGGLEEGRASAAPVRAVAIIEG
jgi:hypothetical protein